MLPWQMSQYLIEDGWAFYNWRCTLSMAMKEIVLLKLSGEEKEKVLGWRTTRRWRCVAVVRAVEGVRRSG